MIKNASEEIQNITQFIEQYQEKQRKKYEELKQAYEEKDKQN